METKTFSQRGITSVVILIGVLLLFIAPLLVILSPEELKNYIIPRVTVIIAIIFLLMYKLNITVSDEAVAFKFGVGLFGKSYKLSEIRSCKPVSYSWLWGYGIRWLPNGWLYNVSGTQAIELEFYNRSGIVRIGTDQPEEVAREINARIAANPNPEKLLEYVPRRGWSFVHLVIVCFFAGFIGLVFYPEFTDTKTQLDENTLIIKGAYGLGIPYNTIETLDILSSLPKGMYRSNGMGGFRTSLGDFIMDDGKSAKLFIRKGATPVLKITTKDKLTVYLNHREKGKTEELYEALKSKRK